VTILAHEKPIIEVEQTLQKLREQNKNNPLFSPDELHKMEKKLEKIDRVEFNEAFAAQVIPSCKDLGIPLSRVNVNGGSIALGHPLGATGARLVTTVAKELRRSNTRYGLATQCIGAGMGISTILERMD
jgi:acetyl-CoA acetyltransferase